MIRGGQGSYERETVLSKEEGELPIYEYRTIASDSAGCIKEGSSSDRE